MTPLRSTAYALVASVAAIACSSGGDTPAPEPLDGNVVPTMVTDSVNSFISDSGVMRYHIISPLWLMYDEADDPYWIFPKGLQMYRYDNNRQIDATMTADTARYFTSRRLWRFDGNVRVRNIRGDRFLTEQVFWDQLSGKIYNDTFIHIELPERILEGYGFTSNQQLTDYTLRHPTGIMPMPQNLSNL